MGTIRLARHSTHATAVAREPGRLILTIFRVRLLTVAPFLHSLTPILRARTLMAPRTIKWHPARATPIFRVRRAAPATTFVAPSAHGLQAQAGLDNRVSMHLVVHCPCSTTLFALSLANLIRVATMGTTHMAWAHCLRVRATQGTMEVLRIIRATLARAHIGLPMTMTLTVFYMTVGRLRRSSATRIVPVLVLQSIVPAYVRVAKGIRAHLAAQMRILAP